MKRGYGLLGALYALGLLFPVAVAADVLAIGRGPVPTGNGQLHACTGTQAAGAAVICVRAGATAGGNGSAAAPFASVQAAVDAAKAGDIVQVAAGVYAGGVRLGAFNAPASKPLTLLGGFSSNFSQRDTTLFVAVLDGNDLAPAVQWHLNTAQSSALDGFTIRNGRGLGTNWENGYGHGGGIHAQLDGNGLFVISNNTIHDNRSNQHTTADSRGGGIHAATQSWGNATGLIRIEDNLIQDNQAGKGAGVHVTGRAAVLRGNRIEDNISHNDHGGGLYVSTRETTVEDNLIRGNVVGATVGYGWGGGVLVAGANADLRGNVITDNFAPTTGAGVFWDEGATGTMKNDLIVRNRCPNGSRSGVAIYVDGGPGGPSLVTLENITVADHLCPATAPTGAAIVVEDGSQASFRNAILWNNTREFATLSGGTFAIVHSISTQAGAGNQVSDPLFADPAGGDYHLRSSAGRYTPAGWVLDGMTSPAIDAGDPVSDFSQEPSPNGGRINLGAYGNTAQASRSMGGVSPLIFASGFE